METLIGESQVLNLVAFASERGRSSYCGKKGRVLLEREQRRSPRAFDVVVCYKCSKQYSMFLARWDDGSPICPNCGKSGTG